MSKPEFIYITYIETSAEKLWQALTDGDFTERYWFGHRVTSDWKAGSPYKFVKPGAPGLEGKVLVSEPPRLLSYSWDCCSPDAQRERTSRVTFALEPHGKIIKLTVTHDELDEARRDLAQHFRRLADGDCQPQEPARDRACARYRSALGDAEGSSPCLSPNSSTSPISRPRRRNCGRP